MRCDFPHYAILCVIRLDVLCQIDQGTFSKVTQKATVNLQEGLYLGGERILKSLIKTGVATVRLPPASTNLSLKFQ